MDRGLEAQGEKLVLLVVAPGHFCVSMGWTLTHKAGGPWECGAGRCGHDAGAMGWREVG